MQQICGWGYLQDHKMKGKQTIFFILFIILSSSRFHQMYPDALNCGYGIDDSSLYYLNGVTTGTYVTYCQAYTPEQRCVRFYLNGTHNSTSNFINIRNVQSCLNKTLATLQSQGRAFDIVVTSLPYTNITGTPIIPAAVTSLPYANITGTPIIPAAVTSLPYANITGTPIIPAAVTSLPYANITGTPIIPAAVTSLPYANITGTPIIPAAVTSLPYANITGTPIIPAAVTSLPYANITGSPIIPAAVTSLPYANITGTPIIPAAVTSLPYANITGTPIIPAAVTSLPYANITGKPIILPPITSLPWENITGTENILTKSSVIDYINLINNSGLSKTQKLIMLATFCFSCFSFVGVIVLCFIVYRMKKEGRVANQNNQVNEKTHQKIMVSTVND